MSYDRSDYSSPSWTREDQQAATWTSDQVLRKVRGVEVAERTRFRTKISAVRRQLLAGDPVLDRDYVLSLVDGLLEQAAPRRASPRRRNTLRHRGDGR